MSCDGERDCVGDCKQLNVRLVERKVAGLAAGLHDMRAYEVFLRQTRDRLRHREVPIWQPDVDRDLLGQARALPDVVARIRRDAEELEMHNRATGFASSAREELLSMVRSRGNVSIWVAIRDELSRLAQSPGVLVELQRQIPRPVLDGLDEYLAIAEKRLPLSLQAERGQLVGTLGEGGGRRRKIESDAARLELLPVAHWGRPRNLDELLGRATRLGGAPWAGGRRPSVGELVERDIVRHVRSLEDVGVSVTCTTAPAAIALAAVIIFWISVAVGAVAAVVGIVCAALADKGVCTAAGILSAASGALAGAAERVKKEKLELGGFGKDALPSVFA